MTNKRTRANKRMPRRLSRTDARTTAAGTPPLPIVGVGASAGGLEAFTELLKHLPLDTGMGFVLVQHLDPQHESALTGLLSRATSLPVQEATNNLRVEPNHVYVIPRNANLSIAHGVLKLQPRPGSRTPHRSIDFFFEALAQDQGERAIGVILSGTATDGTLGLEAIKAEGGITFVQDDSARYDSMPKSATAAGCVDFVLSPKDIASELARIAKHPYVAAKVASPSPESDRAMATAHGDDATPLPSGGHGTPRTGASKVRAEAGRRRGEEASADDGYRKIALLLHNHAGVDLSLYRAATIQRRIARRMLLQKQETLAGYVQFLRGNAKELDTLYSDLLISVTSFFRNPEAFDVLVRKVFPALLQQRSDQPIRAWVLGCSTGQEAYSIAMAFVEAAGQASSTRRLQVFATDLNETLLDKARNGLYARTLAHDVSPERLRRFFVEEEGGYRIIKPLREMVVFARQNALTDPPFSRMDLISCRNLLIYLDASMQKKALPMFHYALKPGGFLFLGGSESIGGFTELFEPIDKKQKIYSKKMSLTPAFHLPVSKERSRQPPHDQDAPPPRPTAERPAPEGLRGEMSAQREADRVTVSRFAPPGVLVNEELQILQFRGPTGAYLVPPSGKATFDVLKMARDDLMLPLRAAINKARKENKRARKENVRLQQNGKTRTVNLEVVPLKNLRERCFLILFEEAGKRTGLVAEPAPKPTKREARGRERGETRAESRRVASLEAELSETRDYVQSIQEQHEAASEELQAANEEVQSANEELQSINEELETSKEELESTNEELTTVNDEMAHRNAELNHLNSDLINLQTSTRLAIVLLGRDLTIRRFSAQAEKVFNLVAADVGRPLGNVRHNLIFVGTADGKPRELEDFVAEVISSVREREAEVQDEGHWYSLRVRPYLTHDNKVDGAVLVLVDIDELKRTERAIKAARDYAEATIRTARTPLVVLRADLRVNTANEAFYKMLQTTPEETIGQLIFDLAGGAWDSPKFRALLEEVLPRNNFFHDFELTDDFPNIGRRTMLLNARKLEQEDGTPLMVLLSIDDVTVRQYAEAATGALAAIVNSSADAIISKDLDGVITSWNLGAERLFGYTAEEAIGQPITMLIPPERMDEEPEILRRLRRGEKVEHFETIRVTKDGTRLEISLTISPIKDATGKVIGASKIARDITQRKRTDEALRTSEARFRELADAMPQIVWAARPDGTIDYFNRRWYEYTGFAEDYRQETWEAILHPDDVERTVDTYFACIREGKPYQIEYRFEDRFRSGYRWFLGQALPIRDEGGEIVRWFGTCTDIDQIKEADRHKDEFLAILAHELRGPLAPMSNTVEILKRAGDNHEKVRQASLMMERQLGQMTRLIEDLLDTRRISQGKLELRPKRVELALVLEHAIESCRPAIESAHQEVMVTLPREPAYLYADTARLAQVFSNLLNNASKFSGPGDRIALTAERQGDDVIVTVKDTGTGIPPDMLDKIFDMFTQVDQSLERSPGGLGIGLTLVRQLVEQHGGSVRAFSEGLGRGSEFIVRLPVLTDQPRPQPRETTASERSAVTGKRILIVDDNRDAGDSLATLLQMTGNETRVAHDGLEALDAGAAFKPDVVLLDIGLPKLNGYDTCRRMREQPWGKDILLVALTGWGKDQDRQKSKDAGFDSHLLKPVDHAALMKVLAESRPTTR